MGTLETHDAVQLTIEPHEFELDESTYVWIFFNSFIEKYFVGLWQFLKIQIHRTA